MTAPLPERGPGPAPSLRRSFAAPGLVDGFPPAWRDPNKRAVWQVSGAGAPHTGTLEYACWRPRPLPATVPTPGPFTVVEGVFDYPPEPEARTLSWHLNFADARLFGFYGGPLLAQDELQVLEHPLLGSLRDALDTEGTPGRTEDPQGRPTPVTVAGVQRRCVFDTRPDPAAGRPRSLYGNAFAAALMDTALAAVQRLDPPTVSNILAIAAPSGGFGPYQLDELEGILETAFSGFAAAAQEGARLRGGPVRTFVHTGFWGCGAFGGNRVVMTVIQALAADLAGVELVFHGVDPEGARTAREAHQRYLDLRNGEDRVPQILEALEAQGFRWGQSDGN